MLNENEQGKYIEGKNQVSSQRMINDYSNPNSSIRKKTSKKKGNSLLIQMGQLHQKNKATSSSGLYGASQRTTVKRNNINYKNDNTTVVKRGINNNTMKKDINPNKNNINPNFPVNYEYENISKTVVGKVDYNKLIEVYKDENYSIDKKNKETIYKNNNNNDIKPIKKEKDIFLIMGNEKTKKKGNTNSTTLNRTNEKSDKGASSNSLISVKNKKMDEKQPDKKPNEEINNESNKSNEKNSTPLLTYKAYSPKENEKENNNNIDLNKMKNKDLIEEQKLREREREKEIEKLEKEKKEKEKREKEKREKERREKEIEESQREKMSRLVNSSGRVDLIVNSKVGLSNLGNTCFMNTCLQNLIHSKDFIERLYSKSEMLSRKTVISNCFYDLCEEMKKSKYSFSPSDFKSEFGRKHSFFRGYSQHDTQEFCRVLLEDMNSELNEIKRPAPYKELSTSGKTKIQCDIEFDELFRKRENSLVMEAFYGQIINIFTCKCGFKEYSFQKILDLPLLLPSGCRRISVKELLEDYFEGEEIQFETKCEECHKKTVHRKEILISRPPNILILSLQRINGRTQRKIDCPVEYPEKLNISEFIDDECGHKNECSYSLYGIGNHSGTMDFGHYYAYIKLDDNNWYEYNDSHVSSMNGISSSSSSAYVLYYKLNTY